MTDLSEVRQQLIDDLYCIRGVDRVKDRGGDIQAIGHADADTDSLRVIISRALPDEAEITGSGHGCVTIELSDSDEGGE